MKVKDQKVDLKNMKESCDLVREIMEKMNEKELIFFANDIRSYIDLKLLNYSQLEEIGIKNIDICSYCTCCMSDIFFSYRKENGITARHSAVLRIKGI